MGGGLPGFTFSLVPRPAMDSDLGFERALAGEGQRQGKGKATKEAVAEVLKKYGTAQLQLLMKICGLEPKRNNRSKSKEVMAEELGGELCSSM